jgi:predicted Zn finger-like uncharacterized protein
MLVTTCKNCGSRFRVTPDQLNLRQGHVRCGQCHEVFNGFESLERFPGDDTGARLLAARAAQSPHALADALGDLEVGQRVRPTPATPGRAESSALANLSDVPDLLLETEEALPAVTPVPVESGPVLPTPVEPAPAGLPHGPPPGPRAGPAPQELPGPMLLEPPPPARPSRAWAFGVVLLALLLGLQLAYGWRAHLAQQYPPLRPILESACARAGCTVPWVNDEAALKLEDSELLEVPGRPGQIALQARIRNLSSAAQEYPHVELTLTDISGQTAVRRVLRPADYLGRAPLAGEVLGSTSEVLISVRLETGRVRPTGYELLLFYP